MICPHCNYPNPNGYQGNCRNCRKPLEVTTVAEKPQSSPKKSKGKAAKKSAKK